MRLERVSTADGRELRIAVEGPPDGRAFVMHTGTPAGLTAQPGISAPAAERGLRTVFYARPGYSGSTPRPGRRVVDAAEDVRAILSHLGTDRFVTLGWSGGGPHALACAAVLPDSCAAAATMAGVAPFDAEGLDWYTGMAPENIEEFTAAQSGVAPLTAWMTPQAEALSAVTGAEVADELGGLISYVDRAALTGDFADSLAAALRESVAAGVAGWRDDDLAFVRPWGFPLSSITTPVAVWQGEHDRMVPFAHGRWLAGHIPGVRVHLEPTHGHLSLVASVDQILDDLLDLAGWR